MITRAKNLEDADIQQIVEMLDGWSGPLTWELLIAAIEKRRFMRYTRQGLHKHERISQAYTARKKTLVTSGANKETAYKTPELQVAHQTIDRLTAEVTRLKAENEHLLEQFVRWAYNAKTRDLDKEFLSQPLPTVDRELTKALSIVRSKQRKK